MRNKPSDLPPVGQGCKQVKVAVGLYSKRDFCMCAKHSSLELNICLGCGELFHTARKHTKTCSDKCRKRLSRMRKEVLFQTVMDFAEGQK